MYGVSTSTLQRHNGIRDSRRLRAGQSLRIPTGGSGGSVAVASASRSPSTAKGNTTYVVHKLARGQTLSHVAKRYGVSVASIQSVNGIRNPKSLRAGQSLKIPRSSRGTATAAYRTHKVGRGQTLSQIAALYRTTVSAIQKVNGISDPERLRSGQVIRIPM
jgi:LysM repeat protein